MSQRALVIGGTGPTGPHVVNGLLERGYSVTILHSGRHESELIPDIVEHVHTDAFDARQVDDALSGRAFEVVAAMYGRLRDLAPLFAGRCERFLSIGGVPVYRGFGWPEANHPSGMRIPAREEDPRAGEGDNPKVVKMAQTEEVVFEYHPGATHLRYPRIYGPMQVVPKEWCVVRRILDGRRRMIVNDGGLTLNVLAYSINAAQALLVAVDKPEIAAGHCVNVTDERTITMGQWIQLIAEGMGVEMELIDMPYSVARPAWPLGESTNHHRILSTEFLRTEMGYRDVLGVEEALPATARWLVDNPLQRGSVTEQGLQDPFDYDAEDRLIDAWGDALARVEPVAAAADPGWVDRYAQSSVDAHLVIDRG